MFIYRWWWLWKNYETANKLGIKVRRIEPNQAKVAYRNKQLLAQNPKLYNLFWKTTLRCNAKCKYCGSRAGDTQLISYESASLEMDFKRRSRKYEWWRSERRKTNQRKISNFSYLFYCVVLQLKWTKMIFFNKTLPKTEIKGIIKIY